MPQTKQLNSVLIKPAGPDCNLVCDYCFYLEKSALFSQSKVHRMNDEVLQETIRQTMNQSANNISFGWQGGEPTLMGVDFFRKAVEYQKRYGRGQSVGNGLQTNGILIDEKWAAFLCDYNFLIGLSLDGPEHIHNRYRKMKSGKGSWQQVMDSAKLLIDKNVEVNALIVVNDYSVNYPEEIYQFHKQLGLNYMQFIPCVEIDDNNPKQSAPFSVSAEKYGSFLCKLFDLWEADIENNIAKTSVRLFDSLFYFYVDLQPHECTFFPACGVYVVIEHNGDVYSCDFFVEPDWKLGNILQDSLIDMLNSDRQHQFGMLKADIPEICKQCEWLRYCLGGCTKDRIRDPQDNNLNHFCTSMKTFMAYADERFKKIAKSWKQQQARFAVLDAIKRGELVVGRNDPCPCGSGRKFKKCCGGEPGS